MAVCDPGNVAVPSTPLRGGAAAAAPECRGVANCVPSVPLVVALVVALLVALPVALVVARAVALRFHRRRTTDVTSPDRTTVR